MNTRTHDFQSPIAIVAIEAEDHEFEFEAYQIPEALTFYCPSHSKYCPSHSR